MRVVCYHMYQVFKPTILNSHSLWLMESQSKSTAKPQSLRQAPVHCDSISKLPVITSRCKSTCDKPKPPEGFAQGLPAATRPDLALSVRRFIFAAEREELLVFEFGSITLELLSLLGFQPCLLVESRPSAHQPLVLLDILPHRVDSPLIPLSLEQHLQLRQLFR